jgi:hypothetical protein
MSKIASKDLTFFTLGGTALAGSLISFDYDIQRMTQSCKAFNARHDTQAEVKAEATFSAQFKRRDATPTCQTAKLVSELTFGALDYLAAYTGATFNTKTNSQRADAAGDEYKSYQAITTDFDGTIDLMIDSTETNTVIDLVATGTDADRRKTLTFTDGLDTLEVPVFFTGCKKTGQDGDLTKLQLSFKGDGTPVSAGGSLFATALTGSAVVTYVINDSIDNIQGSALIDSASITIARDEITKEQYNFLGQGAPTVA